MSEVGGTAHEIDVVGLTDEKTLVVACKYQVVI